MKLVMTLVVRDEADILPAQLHYHRAQGVDFFLVLDHRSIDNTRDQLLHYERKGWLKWFATEQFQRDQGLWVTTLARRACIEFQADWVINNDADEFWWSPTGTLKTHLQHIAPQYRLVHAPRINFWAPNTPEAAPDRRPFWEQQLYHQVRALNFLGEPLSGKVCHRAEKDIVVHHGNHSVSPMSFEDIAPINAKKPLHILHFPIRNYPQFERKVRNGAGSLIANPQLTTQIGKGIRTLYARYLQGQLPAFYTQWQAQHQQHNRQKNTDFRDFMKKINPDLTEY